MDLGFPKSQWVRLSTTCGHHEFGQTLSLPPQATLDRHSLVFGTWRERQLEGKPSCTGKALPLESRSVHSRSPRGCHVKGEVCATRTGIAAPSILLDLCLLLLSRETAGGPWCARR